MLASIVLALHHNARWNMRKTNRRVSLINMLTTSTRCAIRVGPNIGGIDLNLNGVINFGLDINTGK